MATFGKVGTCTRAATRIVEGFSPLDGDELGRLDRVVYTCDNHHQAARADWLRGLTPHTTEDAPIQPATCGVFTEFEPQNAA